MPLATPARPTFRSLLSWGCAGVVAFALIGSATPVTPLPADERPLAERLHDRVAELRAARGRLATLREEQRRELAEVEAQIERLRPEAERATEVTVELLAETKQATDALAADEAALRELRAWWTTAKRQLEIDAADDATALESFRRRLQQLGDTVTSGRRFELHNAPVDLSGERRLNAWHLSIGEVGHVFLSEDGTVVGVRDAATGEWNTAPPPEVEREIRRAIAIARGQSRLDLVAFPLYRSSGWERQETTPK